MVFTVDKSGDAELARVIAPGDRHARRTHGVLRGPLRGDHKWPADRLIAAHHGARDRAGLIVDHDGQLVGHGSALERYDVPNYRRAIVANLFYVITWAKPGYEHHLFHQPHSLNPELSIGRGRGRERRDQMVHRT